MTGQPEPSDDGVPDFTHRSDGPLGGFGGIPVAVLLHLEKVQQNDEPWANLQAAYRLLFGVEMDITAPVEDIHAEIMAAMSALAPSVPDEIVRPKDERNQRGAVAKAAGLPDGPRTVQPVPPRLLEEIPPPPPYLAPVRSSKARWWFLPVGFYAGAGWGATDWGDFGRAVLWSQLALLGITLWVRLTERRGR